jgi:hypothetical protein
MKHHIKGGVFAVVLALALAGAGYAQSEEALHVVISVDGEATLSYYSDPGNYSDEVPLTAGSFIKSSDVIDVPPGSSVSVLCANRSTDTISGERRSPNCASTVAEPLVAFNSVEIYGQQRAAVDEIVYVTAPRHSIILTNQPTVEWVPLSRDDVTYRVTLYNTMDNSIVWEKSGVRGSQLAYPQDVQPLAAVDPAERPIRYQFVITPIVNGQELRNFDPLRPEGFCIVSARNRPLLERAVNDLNSVRLPDGQLDRVTNAFNLAVYYHGRRMYSEAMALLEENLLVPLNQPFPSDQISAESILGSPSYYLLLANVYYAQRMPLADVQAAYQRAQEIAIALDDTVALATINEQLADILRGRKPQINQTTDAAIYQRYLQAQEYFELLDDAAAVERISTKLSTQPTVAARDLCQ